MARTYLPTLSAGHRRSTRCGNGRAGRTIRSIRWCVDALRVKIRDEGLVKNKAVDVAHALNPDGNEGCPRAVDQSGGAKFCLRVVNEPKTRGVGDILIAVWIISRAFPRRSRRVYPQTD